MCALLAHKFLFLIPGRINATNRSPRQILISSLHIMGGLPAPGLDLIQSPHNCPHNVFVPPSFLSESLPFPPTFCSSRSLLLFFSISFATSVPDTINHGSEAGSAFSSSFFSSFISHFFTWCQFSFVFVFSTMLQSFLPLRCLICSWIMRSRLQPEVGQFDSENNALLVSYGRIIRLWKKSYSVLFFHKNSLLVSMKMVKASVSLLFTLFSDS